MDVNSLMHGWHRQHESASVGQGQVAVTFLPSQDTWWWLQAKGVVLRCQEQWRRVTCLQSAALWQQRPSVPLTWRQTAV